MNSASLPAHREFVELGFDLRSKAYLHQRLYEQQHFQRCNIVKNGSRTAIVDETPRLRKLQLEGPVPGRVLS
jgi:hypothetical protein